MLCFPDEKGSSGDSSSSSSSSSHNQYYHYSPLPTESHRSLIGSGHDPSPGRAIKTARPPPVSLVNLIDLNSISIPGLKRERRGVVVGWW